MPLADRSVKVTVVIPTLNEEDRLIACLESVRWAAEVIVADAGSTDATRMVAQHWGATVLTVTAPTIGAQRNAAIERASHPWVLCLDADERVSAPLADAIAAVAQTPPAAAYVIRFRNTYLGAPMSRGCWGRDRHLRLAPASARWNANHVHERYETDVPVREIDGWIEHDSYRDLAHQLSKVQRYAASGAHDLIVRHKRKAGVSELVVRPAFRFIKLYLLQGAWRDGRRGFVLSVVHAWSAFAKYALVWDAIRMESAHTARHNATRHSDDDLSRHQDALTRSRTRVIDEEPMSSVA